MSREPRISVNARVDIRHLAGLALYLEGNNRRSQTRSDLIHASISILHALLAAQGQIEPIDTAEEAVQILQSLGLEFKFGSRGHEDLVKSLQAQEGVEESLKTIVSTDSGKEKLKQLLTEKLKNMKTD